MKIGIMTMQRIRNYGSFLQGYGLQQLLKENEENVFFVDYHPGEIVCDTPQTNDVVEKKKFSSIRNLIFRLLCLVDSNRRNKWKKIEESALAYNRFNEMYAKQLQQHLGVNESRYASDENLDMLVIGSDEVFNCTQNNPEVGCSKDLYAIGIEAKHTISYAASFGSTTYEKLKNYHLLEMVKSGLNGFDAISVRDENSSRIVAQLLGRQPDVNLDPVLIYEFEQEIVKDYLAGEKYLLLYAYGGRLSEEEKRAVKDYAVRNNLKIYCPDGLYYDICDQTIPATPFELLGMFKNAQCIVTDTFHGSVISMKYHKKFVAISRNGKNYAFTNAEKMIDLLKRTGMSGHLAYSADEIEKVLKAEHEYEHFEKIIADARRQTRKYLAEQCEIARQKTCS